MKLKIRIPQKKGKETFKIHVLPQNNINSNFKKSFTDFHNKRHLNLKKRKSIASMGG